MTRGQVSSLTTYSLIVRRPEHIIELDDDPQMMHVYIHIVTIAGSADPGVALNQSIT